MIVTQSQRPKSYRIEALLACVIALAIAYDLYHLFDAGYLPSPFFYEPQDTWMDWFNAAYYAHNSGAYDSWRTVYPPLSFVVLRLLTNGSCYLDAFGYPSRDCDIYGVVSLHAIYFLNIYLTFRTLLKIDRRTALPRTFALCLGYPMLFALERGNVLLIGYTCVILAYGPLLRSARLRWLFAGLSANFKVYLIGPIFAQILKRRWRWFERSFIMTVIIYLLSYAILGEGSPVELFENITIFTTAVEIDHVLNVAFAMTYWPIMGLLNGPLPVTALLGSGQVALWSTILPICSATVQAIIIIAALAAAWKPAAVPMYRLVFLSLALPLISAEAGGYSEIFLILFIFMERFRGYGRPVAIISAYLLCIAIELPLERVPPLFRDSYLTGRPVAAEFYVGALAFLRPLLVWIICVAISLVTIRDVLAKAREDGWKWRRARSNEAAVS